MNFLANILSLAGSLVATTNSNACFLAIFDEPECPKSLIK